MAVYKIFPEKDASIYSAYPNKNTGLDEILEISIYNDPITLSGQVSRALIKFPDSEIHDIIANKVNGANYSASLKLFLADATDLPYAYTLQCYPITTAWDMGSGRVANVPTSSDGASWNNATATIPWGITGSDYNLAYLSTQSFSYQDEKDINIDVTNSVKLFYSGSLANNGFVLKHISQIEFLSTASLGLNFFSNETHTIYPPCLEIKWDDFSYVTGSGQTVTTDSIVATVRLKQEFEQDSIQRVRVNVRDKYPTRIFQTSSLYLNNKYLPTASYYQIRDVGSDEIAIDFDPIFTKLSADITSNYFDLYMSGLQPERWYKILIKTTINGSTLIIDNENLFKVRK